MNKIPENIELLIEDIFQTKSLIQAILSGPRLDQNIAKITIRPIQKKQEFYYQITESTKSKDIHSNLTPYECQKLLENLLLNYKQAYLFTHSGDFHILVGKKENITVLKKPPSKTPLILAHNRQKKYLLQEGEPIPFLIKLGVMNQEGKVYPAKMDKFKQINRFVEIVEDVLPSLKQKNCLKIIDFGCGKAYLTFALYHYLKISKGYEVSVTGLDLKEELIFQCRTLANTLGYQQDLQFIQGSIKDYHTEEKPDIIISLHACDTATDEALNQAVKWEAKIILSVPCCQHELFSQIRQPILQPLLKHGILKERFAALATDAARAELLEIVGYKTQIVEFIDAEHTPKNLLIRAIRHEKFEPSKEARHSYQAFKEFLNVHPYFEKLLKIN